MENKHAETNQGILRIRGFADRRLERLFWIRNVKHSLIQSRFALILGLILFMSFSALDHLIVPESLFISLLVRLGVAPVVFSFCLFMTWKHKGKIEVWSFIILVGTQLGHIFLALVCNFPSEYFAFISSIVIVFPLTFATIRYIHAVIYLVFDLILLFIVLIFGLRADPVSIVYVSFIVGAFSLIGLIGGYSREWYVRMNFLQANELDAEKKKSEALLLNILPAQVARELKTRGKALPVNYEGVTVLFADFVGFTQITEGIAAEPVISTLDKYFSYFDYITKKYDLEKIKTIGDAYMLAGGLDTSIPTHAIDCILAAFDFMDFVKRDAEECESPLCFDMRIGVHTGPVIAGVLGSLKFSYDIFGSTVNMASRMEKYSAPNKVNISRSTYEQVKDFFECENRGIVEAKNGETYEMFYVHGIKKDLCLDFDNNFPNAAFVAMYNEVKRKGC